MDDRTFVGVDRSEAPNWTGLFIVKPRPRQESLVELWSQDIRRASDRLVRVWNEERFGTTKVRDDNDRVIADCTTTEAADAARRLLGGQ